MSCYILFLNFIIKVTLKNDVNTWTFFVIMKKLLGGQFCTLRNLREANFLGDHFPGDQFMLTVDVNVALG